MAKSARWDPWANAGAGGWVTVETDDAGPAGSSDSSTQAEPPVTPSAPATHSGPTLDKPTRTLEDLLRKSPKPEQPPPPVDKSDSFASDPTWGSSQAHGVPPSAAYPSSPPPAAPPAAAGWPDQTPAASRAGSGLLLPGAAVVVAAGLGVGAQYFFHWFDFAASWF
jgi:hypothetical protein